MSRASQNASGSDGRNDSGESRDGNCFSLSRDPEAAGYAASRNSMPVVRQVSVSGAAAAVSVERPERMAAAAGWTEDQFKILFSPLCKGTKRNWSMGDDAPPAFLSNLPRTLWDYCKQRFAQVTNPPIDSLRESHVMSLAVHLKNGSCCPVPNWRGAARRAFYDIRSCTEHRLYFFRPNEVPGARCSLAQ